MYSIGEIISTYRKKKGLLQQDLADELAKEGIKISYKAISNWERNLAEPSVTIFYKVCRILGITNMYEAYFGVNPADPFSSLTDEGREKAMDYINLLHASGMYEKQTAKIIPFRSIDIFENAVSAGTGNFLVDGPKETVRIDESILPEDTTFGVRISGDSMEPEFHDGQIAWVLQQESVANGEIGIFALNGEAYIKKLKDDKDGIFLISLNEKYAPIKVGENDRLDIFGKVLGKSDASALDYATDAALRNAISNLNPAPTLFIVSQRAASLMHADKIIVLDDGEMVGIGTHEELLAGCEVYQEIYNSQFKQE